MSCSGLNLRYHSSSFFRCQTVYFARTVFLVVVAACQNYKFHVQNFKNGSVVLVVSLVVLST